MSTEQPAGPPDAGRVRRAWRSTAFDRSRARLYDAGVEHEWLGRPLGRLIWGVSGRWVYGPAGELAGLRAGAAVLDVPCGGGLAFRGVRPDQPIRYVAVDVSPGQLGRAHRRARRRGLAQVSLVEADMARLPFDDGSFDLCLTLNGLNAVDEPEAALRQMHRCLRPGGRLRGTTLIEGAGRRFDWQIRYWQRSGGFGPVGSYDDVRGWLEAAGLRRLEVTRSGAVLHFTAERPA